jgi:hypothetical protein
MKRRRREEKSRRGERVFISKGRGEGITHQTNV